MGEGEAERLGIEDDYDGEWIGLEGEGNGEDLGRGGVRCR